jgi:thiamine pyrophosphate-dependent acetolactate synthase large subunit-like protein
MPALAHALLMALRDHGAHEIFGIPGDFVLPLFKVIEESNILQIFTLSHSRRLVSRRTRRRAIMAASALPS